MRYMRDAVQASDDAPVLLDSFLSAAVEVDVDACSDGEQVVIGAIMQHIEQAGVHSGDSACSLPPYSLDAAVQDEMREQIRQMALELGVMGLMNVQLAWQDDEIYVIEVNPRASRTVPFVSKCIGASLAKVAARCMAGQSLASQGLPGKLCHLISASRKRCCRLINFPAWTHTGAGNEIYRRGDGHRRHLRRRICQGATGGWRVRRPLVAPP